MRSSTTLALLGAVATAGCAAAGPAAHDTHKSLYTHLLAEMDAGNPSAADEIIAEHCVWHMPGGADVRHGAVAFKESDAEFRAAFSDLYHDVEALIAEGDMLVARLLVRAVHTAPFAGVQPTGREVVFTGMGIYRFENGKIVEGWVEYDALGLMQQIGAVQFAGTP